MAAPSDVFTYIIYIIKEVAEGVEQEVGLTIVFDGLWIGDDLDAQMLDMHIDVLARHDGVAVVVDGTLRLPVYAEALSAEGLDLRVVRQCLHEEVGSYLGCLERVEGFHDDHVHHAVLHRGTRGDIGVVAVLRGVGTGDEKGLVALGARFVLYLVGLWAVVQTFLQHVFHIGDRAALASLRELQRDEGVEAHTAGAEEGQVVDHAVVEILDAAGVDDADGTLDVEWQTEMPSQSVARTAGDDAERRLGVNQRASHLVHRTVATDGHHHVDALSGTLLGDLSRMAGIFRQPELIVELLLVEQFVDETWYLLLRVGARNRVQDEDNAFLFFHNLTAKIQKKVEKQGFYKIKIQKIHFFKKNLHELIKNV